MRGVMIAVGAVMISRFAWTTYVFGTLLIITAVRMARVRHDNLEPDRTPLVRLARRFFPVTDGLRGERFWVVENGRTAITPLLLVLLTVEATDLLFAVDSIPAIFAVTQDPFLVYTSNVFAILGLRSLYFALAPLLGYFRFLKASLILVLAFVGVKMLLAHHHPIPVLVSLAIILSILSIGVAASWFMPARHDGLRSPVEAELDRLFRLTRGVVVRCTALAVGGSLMVVGAFFLLIPGLGVKVILGGLALLAPQFVWARSLLARAEALAGRVSPRGTPPPGDG
jgi:tellurite resistance protein TerC